jgi:phosphoglycolate phosphatase
MQPAAAILTDLDNTLYNWIDFYAPAFRAMVHTLARETRTEESVLIAQFESVFARHGSTEYPYCIQELELCRSLPKERVDALLHCGRVAFGKTRRRRLSLYVGVRRTLEWAKANCIPVVAVSNAPWYLAWRRIWRLGLKGLISGIAAAEGFELDESVGRFLVKRRAFQPAVRWTVGRSDLKPNPTLYTLVLESLSLNPGRTWIVGDDLDKDIRPAVAVGAISVWAAYGRSCDARNLETVMSITHWQRRKQDVRGGESVVPSYTIGSFDELIDLVPTSQLQLWEGD